MTEPPQGPLGFEGPYQGFLNENCATLAEVLGKADYHTLMAGKWHVGLHRKEKWPLQRGFDRYYGCLSGACNYFKPGGDRGITFGNKAVETDQEFYATDTFTDYACRFVREAVEEDDRPFFLYLAYNAPHYPMHAPQEYMDRFAHLDWDRQVMAAMLAAVDDSVGAILDEVERLGMAEDTCSFFTSDNGPSRETRNWLDGTLDPYYGSSSGKLKGHKFSLYEGGIRLPGIMHWPGRIPAGQVLDAPCASMDIFPTFLQIAGGDSSQYEIDGIDILPYVADGAVPQERTLFWEMGKQTAVRRGDWKLVLDGQLVEGAPAEDAVHLANLETDMGEQHNAKDEQPELTVQLQTDAQNWRADIEARWEREYAPKKQGTVTHG